MFFLVSQVSEHTVDLQGVAQILAVNLLDLGQISLVNSSPVIFLADAVVCLATLGLPLVEGQTAGCTDKDSDQK